MDEKLVEKFESDVDYDTKLSNFEGPLDLLLFLIKKAEIEIKDIFVSEVTSQYLKYIENLEEVGIDKASEYLGIAATILEIKSKELLPKIEFDDDNSFEEDSGEMLIRQLNEYNLFKEESLKLKELENINRFYKPPEDSASDVRIIYKDFNLGGLIQAFTKLMEKVDIRETIKNQEKEIPKEVFTVKDKVNYIYNTLKERGECSFFELFSPYFTKSELITTFQAMLEMLKRDYIFVEQLAVYDDITIFFNNFRSDDTDDLGEIDEYN